MRGIHPDRDQAARGAFLLAVEGAAATDSAIDLVAGELARDGRELVRGPIERALGRPPDPRLVLLVSVETRADAARATTAAMRGFGVLVLARGERELMDRLYDDLRRLGRLSVRSAPLANVEGDAADEGTAVLEQLAAGKSLAEAARALHMSRRTADRRLAAARDALGASTTAEAIARLRTSRTR